jgi:MYXO-CTERM domain-containing protein
VLLLLSMLTHSAWALPAAGGAEVVFFQRGLDFVSERIGSSVLKFEEPLLSGSVDCYDELGVRDLSLTVPISSVAIDLSAGELDLLISLDTIYAEDLTLYGLDADYLDYCVEFETEVHYVEVREGLLRASVRPTVQDGELVIEVVGTPRFTGRLDVDIEWFPDDLALYFFEEALFDLINDEAEEIIEEALVEVWESSMLSGQVDDFELSAELEEASAQRDALRVSGDVSVAWLGDPSCTVDRVVEPGGRSPELDWSEPGDASVGLGVTEQQLNRIFTRLWEDGYLCFTEERMGLLWDSLEGLFDPELGGVRAAAVFGQPPFARLRPGGAVLELEQLSLDVQGTKGGESIEMIHAELSLRVALQLALEPELTSMVLTVHELELDVHELRADHLLTGETAERQLIDFVEGWLVDWAAEELDGVALFTTQFSALDAVMRIQEVRWSAGALGVLARLYDEDDPAVDRTAPDTFVEGLTHHTKRDQIAVQLHAEDDREGPLPVSWSVDGSSWSSWSTSTEVVLEGLQPGEHSFSAKARDSWLNVDSSPVEIVFEIDPDPEEEPKAGCGCTTGSSGARWLWLLAGVLVAVRREVG